MAKKKLPWVVGRIDGGKLPSGKRRRRFRLERSARAFATLLTAKEKNYPPGGYYIDGPDSPQRVTQKKERIVPMCQYIDVRSSTRADLVHHVYTGDNVNNPHCTCENMTHGTRECEVLFVCKHIDEVVFGIRR